MGAYFVGTFAFSSSVQFSTTSICGVTGAPDGVWPAVIMPMNRLPSGVMSYGLAPALNARLARNPRGSGTGLLTTNDGCVVTLTTVN